MKSGPPESFEGYQPPEPTDPAEIHFKNAWRLRKQKKYVEAVAEFMESLRHEPDKAATHFNLGLVYDDLGDGPNAFKFAQKAQSLFARQNDVKHSDTARRMMARFSKKYNLESSG